MAFFNAKEGKFSELTTAVRYDSSVEIIQALITASPESLLRGDKDGYLPIHHAARLKSSVEIMQALITASPESLLRGDKDGCLPIHHAVSSNGSVEKIQALIAASPDSLLRGDKKDGWLPIHYGIRYDSSVGVLQALITASPGSLLRGDKCGYLPIHRAAINNSSVQVMQALITASPESLLRRDKDGCLPIHHAASRNSSVEVMQALIAASPESLLWGDKNGNLPIKFACSNNHFILLISSVKSFLSSEVSLDKIRQVVLPNSLAQALSVAGPSSSSSLTVHVCGQKLAGKSTLTSWLVSQLEQQPSVFGPLARLTVSAKSKDIIPFSDRTPGMVSHRVQGKTGEQFTVHDYGGHEEYWMTYRQFLNAPSSVYIVVLPRVEKRSDTEHCPFKVSALAAQYEAWLNLISSSLQLKDDMIKKTGDAPLPVVITLLNRFSGTVPKAERESTASVREALTACQGQEPFKSRFRFYQPILDGNVLNEHDSMVVREAIASAGRPILQTPGQSRESVKFIADLQASFEAEPAADFLVESAYRADVQRRLRASGYQDEEELPLLQLLEDCWMDHCVRTRRVALVQRRAGREAVVATSVSALSNKLFGKVLEGMRQRRCVVIERQDVAEIVKAGIQVGLEVDAADLLVELHLFLRITAYDASTGQAELQAAGQAAESSPRDKFLVIGLIERRAAKEDIVLPDFRAKTSRRLHRFYTLDRRQLASWGSGFFMSLFLRILSLAADCVSPRIFKDGLSAMVEDGRRRTRYLVRPSSRKDVGDGFELVVDVSAEDASALSFAEVAREDDEVLRGVRAVSAEVRRLMGEAVLEYCTYPDPDDSLEDMLSGDAEAKLAQAEAAGLRTRFQLRKYLYGHYPIESVVLGQEGTPQRVVEGALTAAQFAAGIQLLQSQVEKSLEITSALYQQFAEASQATLQQLDRLERDTVGDRAGQPSSTEADDIGAGEQQGGDADLEGLLQEMREGCKDLRAVARSVKDMEQTLDNIFRAQLSLSRGMCDFPLLVVLEEAPWRLTQALSSVLTKPYRASCICPVCRQRVAPSAEYELRVSRGKWAKYLLRALQVSVVLGGMALRVAGVPGAAVDVVYECTKSALSAVSQDLGAELAQFSGDIKQAVASCVGGAASAAARNQSSSMLPPQQLQLLQQLPSACSSGSVGQVVVVSIEYIHAMKALFARSLKDPAAERSGLVRVTSDQGDVAFVCGESAWNCRQEFKEKGRRCLSVVVTFGGRQLSTASANMSTPAQDAAGSTSLTASSADEARALRTLPL
eukprot:gene26916-32526_t